MMEKWKNIIEEKPRFGERVIIDDGVGTALIAYYNPEKDKWYECSSKEIDKEAIGGMVFWRYAERAPLAWKASNGLYYALFETNMGIGSVCPLCGKELTGVIASNGNNCNVCIECGVGEHSGYGFFRTGMSEETEKLHEDILSKIKRTTQEVYRENPISESDSAILSKTLAMIKRHNDYSEEKWRNRRQNKVS